MEDDRIVELYLSRNEEAIGQTARKYGPRLRQIADRILHDEGAAEECENETYWEAWRSIPPHEPRTYLFAFLGRITRHLALNICKRDSRQKRYAVYTELTAEMRECLPAAASTESDFEGKQLAEAINVFLAGCTEAQQIVFTRRYWYFDSIADIASATGFSQSKVKTMLFRLRAGLRKQLEEGGFDV